VKLEKSDLSQIKIEVIGEKWLAGAKLNAGAQGRVCPQPKDSTDCRCGVNRLPVDSSSGDARARLYGSSKISRADIMLVYGGKEGVPWKKCPTIFAV
jgi:hypothetical protein